MNPNDWTFGSMPSKRRIERQPRLARPTDSSEANPMGVHTLLGGPRRTTGALAPSKIVSDEERDASMRRLFQT